METLSPIDTDTLPVFSQGIVLRKSESYFAAHFNMGDGNAFLGVISEGRLVAQAMILHPTAAEPETGMVDMAPVGPPQAVSVLQAVAVLPECRGAGLMNRLVAQWLEHAAAYGRDHVLAEIEVRNTASWAAFLTAGLNLQSIGRDPADGTLVYNAHEHVATARTKKLTNVFNDAATIACPASDIARQQELMKDGYVAAGWDRAQKLLAMRKPAAPL
jgi:hypothetical protein